jgi:hypothetical protein
MNSNYNKELHTIIPTLDYFKTMTGMDYIKESGYPETEAKAKFQSLVLKAKDFLMSDKSSNFQNAFNYMTMKYELFAQAFEKYAVRYIEATFKYGDEAGWDKVPFEIKNAINGSVLKAYEYTSEVYSEIELSDLEW